MAPPQIRTLYELGRGGMGAVDLVEQTGRDGKTLAARKRMLPELLREPRSRAMFLREARLLARIDHPNVVRTLGIDEGDDERPPSLLLEYVKGVALVALLERAKAPLPVAAACRIAHDVALGLHAAHGVRDDDGKPLSVVHRDVSPHNVVVTFDGEVKLLDFGVAKVEEGTRTQTGEVRGKVAYMAPEQALAEAVDRRADVYALGAVLFELLTGERLHGHGTDLEILRRMATAKPRGPRELRPEIPEAIDALVRAMTAEAKDARPATAADVAAALAPFARDAQRVDLAALVRGLFPEAEATLSDRELSARERPGATEVRAGRSKLPLAAAFALVAVASVTWLAWPRPHARSSDAAPTPSASVPSSAPSTPTVAPVASASAPAAPIVVVPRSVVATPQRAAPSAARPVVAPRVDEKPF